MAKIPKRLKGTDVIAMGNYAVFTKSFTTAVAIAGRLSKKDKKTGIPCMGSIKYLGCTYYWCRYGFLNDADIYTSK